MTADNTTTCEIAGGHRPPLQLTRGGLTGLITRWKRWGRRAAPFKDSSLLPSEHRIQKIMNGDGRWIVVPPDIGTCQKMILAKEFGNVALVACCVKRIHHRAGIFQGAPSGRIRTGAIGQYEECRKVLIILEILSVDDAEMEIRERQRTNHSGSMPQQ